MAENDIDFKDIISKKNIPILTLDNKWHKLFTQAEESKEMTKVAKEVNELVARQGKITTELKDMKKLKAKLMDDIVANMEASKSGGDKKAAKIVDESKRLIDEINEKTEAYEDEMLELPKKLREANNKLMLLTMEECYALFKDNSRDIETIGAWIKKMRVELKRNILKKQHMEIVNIEVYSWLSDIFGAEVMDMFDIGYDIEGAKQEMIKRKEALLEEKARKEAEAKKEPGKEAESGKDTAPAGEEG